MKLWMLFFGLLSINANAYEDDCIIVTGVVKSLQLKEVLPNSNVLIYRGNELINVIRTDNVGAYKLIYSETEFKGLSLKVECFDIEKNYRGKEVEKYFDSRKVKLADLYFGKSVIVYDFELELKLNQGRYLSYPYFEFNKDRLSDACKLFLNGMVQNLDDNSELTIQVIGNQLKTENEGLAILRARNSIDYLISKGIDKNRMRSGQQVFDESISILDFKYPPYFPVDSMSDIKGISKRSVSFRVLSTDGIIPKNIKDGALIPETKFVYGRVIDMNTKDVLYDCEVSMSGTNGKYSSMQVDHNGYYFFEVDSGVMYQIQGSSNETVSKYQLIEVLKYFASEKALLKVSGYENSFQQNLEVEAICNYGIVIPEITFAVNQAYLLDESKLKLNGLVETLIDNPILNLEFNYSKNEFENNEEELWLKRIRSIQSYLTSKGINPHRFSIKEKKWDGSMSAKDSTKNLELLPDFEFPKQLNTNSFEKLKKTEKEILKYWFTKVRFTLKRNSVSNVKDQVLVKGTVWDAFESKPKSNIDLIVQSNGSVVDTIQTDENGEYWFIGSRQQNYQVALGRLKEAINCMDLKCCSSEIAKDFVWLNPHQYNAEEVMVYGFVKDLLTKELVGNVKVVITGSDGSNRELITGKYGVYYFSLDRNTTYQIQATSDEKEIGLYENELYKYFGSEKVLTSTIDNYHSRRASLYLERVMRCYFYLPVYNFEDGIFDLDDSNKLKFNGLIETMNDNPTLVLKLGFRESFNHNQDSIINIKRFQNIQNYLIRKGFDNRRLEYNSNLEPLIITKEILESSGFYPQLELDQKITKEVYDTFNTYTKSYIDKYIGNSVIEVVRTDFKP